MSDSMNLHIDVYSACQEKKMAPNKLPEKLENTYVILITHDHKDHTNYVTVNRLRREVTLVVGPER